MIHLMTKVRFSNIKTFYQQFRESCQRNKIFFFFTLLPKDRITLNGYKRSWSLFIIPMNSFELQGNNEASVQSFCSIYVWFHGFRRV